MDFFCSRFEGEAALKNSSLFFFSPNSCLFCCKGPHQEEIQKQKEFISKAMDVVKDFEEKGAKPKIYGIPAYKTEDNKLEKQHPTASTPIHDNHATADFATQPLVSPIQNHLTLPPVLP
jgi:hypothetical protein